MNSSSTGKENKSNIIYGKINGYFPLQIKSKLKTASDPIKFKNGREPLKENKDHNILNI